MKKIITILALFICMQFSAYSLNYLLCLNGQSYYIQTNSQGLITGWTTAGGCAGGTWVIQLLIAPPGGGGHHTDQGIATQLNRYMDFNGPYPPATLPTQPYSMDEIERMLASASPVWLDPNDLNKDVLDWMAKYPRLQLQGESVPEMGLPEFNLYPNPANDEINLMLAGFPNSNTSYEVEIINYVGQTMLKELISFKEGVLKKSFNIFGMSKGIYILRFSNSNERNIKRFVKN